MVNQDRVTFNSNKNGNGEKMFIVRNLIPVDMFPGTVHVEMV